MNSGKRRHSGDMGAKSQLNGGIFYIILWLMHVLQALSDKIFINLFWKTLAQQEIWNGKKNEQKKSGTKMVKIYIKNKTEDKHVIFCTYKQLKNITPK
ncbi:hypothetical protein ACNKHR_08005 [Shigella flexneri]